MPSFLPLLQGHGPWEVKMYSHCSQIIIFFGISSNFKIRMMPILRYVTVSVGMTHWLLNNITLIYSQHIHCTSSQYVSLKSIKPVWSFYDDQRTWIFTQSVTSRVICYESKFQIALKFEGNFRYSLQLYTSFRESVCVDYGTTDFGKDILLVIISSCIVCLKITSEQLLDLIKMKQKWVLLSY